MADIQDYKYMDDAGFRKYTSILVGLMSKASTLESRCVMPYDNTKQYSSTELVIKDGAIYEAKTATTGTWDPTKWTVMDGTEIDASKVIDAAKIDALMTSVSQDTWDYLEQIISDDAVSTKKTYSSSKVVNELVNQESVLKAYVLTEIAKHSTGSYEIASSTADMTDTAVFYLLKNGSNYDIYALLSGTPTKLTSLNIDLTAYLKSVDAESTYLKKTDASATYATIAALDDKLDADDYKLTDLIDDTTSGTDKVYSSDKTEKRILQHLNSGNTEIKENDDLNTYLTAGVYTCVKSATAKTLLNCPHTKSNFKLIVDKNTGNDTSFWGTQIIKGTLNSPCTDVCVYYRGVTYETSTTSYSFTEWKQMATLEKVNNPNLLDNPWFTVNQRGKSSYTVTNKYSIDRWKTWGTLTIDVSDGITINKSSNDVRYFYQCLESNLCNELSGKTVTVSVLLQNGDLHEETLLFDSTKTIGITDGWSVNIANEPALHASGKIIRFWNNSSADSLQLKAVKLELGSVSTLANDTAPNYATELAKCQRYYQRIISSSATANTYYTLGYAISTPCVEWNIQYPVEMRAKPTVTWDATKINYTIFGNNATNSVPFTDAPAAGVPFTGYDGGTKMMYFRCNDNTNKPFTVGQPVRITFTPNTVIELSADL